VKRFLFTAALVVTLALALVGAGTAATVRGIVPLTVGGNPSCSNLSGVSWSQTVKFSPPVNGASANGLFLTVENGAIGWYVLRDIRDITMRAVIVKGGSNANAYIYPGGDYSDGQLYAPTNPKNGKPYDAGAVTFCFDVATS
jgi:hypothetical protein